MTPRRLVLWDVDGTLLRAGPAAGAAFDEAVRSALALDPGPLDHRVHMSGKTDPQIALEVMAAVGVAAEVAEGHLEAVLARLEDEIARAASIFAKVGRVLPGVAEVLARLHDEPAVVQTVLTGNLAANAMVKLSALGLERWLDLEVGAYGSDHRDRTCLVPIALERVRDRYGVAIEASDVWVVGDTPRDLACARAVGCRCLLVATGKIDLAELEAAEPDALFADLSDVERVVQLFAD